MDKDLFLNRIKELKLEIGIRLSSHITNNMDRRRIAISILEEFLRAQGSVEQGMFLERELYDELEKEKFICEEIPYEMRSRELRHKEFNPLRIHFSERQHDQRTYFTETIINILKEIETDGKSIRGHRRKQTGETRKLAQRKRFDGFSRSK